jgi:hypothetical protein
MMTISMVVRLLMRVRLFFIFCMIYAVILGLYEWCGTWLELIVRIIRRWGCGNENGSLQENHSFIFKFHYNKSKENLNSIQNR